MNASLRIVRAALAYWAAVFALGFVLGTLRVTLLAPRLGETPAVLIELPAMLAASWLSARRWIAPRLATRSEAVAAGTLAFMQLMGAELALAALAFGQDLQQWLGAQTQVPGAIGLGGQIAFALFPALAWRPHRN